MMLYIVDGTGSDNLPLWRDYQRYDKEMRHGMCDRMRVEFDGVYYRGPSLLGTETFGTADSVYKRIKKDPGLHKQPLFLAGHSRGGAAVIWIANLLKKDAIDVDGMFLFDAVDRTLSLKSVAKIPENVKFVAHALRDRSLALIYDQAARGAKQRFFECNSRNRGRGCDKERLVAENYIKFDDAMKVRSRAGGSGLISHGIDFSNCGLLYDGAADKFNTKVFPGSHGAIGGSPIWMNDYDAEWLTAEDKHRYRNIIVNDKMAMKLVWDWMSAFFEKTNLTLHNGVATPIKKPPTYPWPERPQTPR